MSRPELPESHPLHHLEQLVRNLGEELAAFRKRALQAEARLREFEAAAQRPGDLFAEQRVAELERENMELKQRLAAAAERTRSALQQIRFLRQQALRPVSGPTKAVVDDRETSRRSS